jgi:hypothetical protein
MMMMGLCENSRWLATRGEEAHHFCAAGDGRKLFVALRFF